MKEPPIVIQVQEWFIKPKIKQQDEPMNHQPVHIHLTPWDLNLLSVHYNQKGLVFTKPSNQPNFSFNKLIHTLKESLSLTLVHFYPLSGQLGSRTDPDRKQDMVVYIDCTKGPGVRFIQAELEMTVMDIVSPKKAVPKVVHALFDSRDWRVVNHDGVSRPLLSVQVTELVDGAFIGCSMNHAVCDGTSFWHFWNVWSQIHRAYVRGGGGEVVRISSPPVHDRWFPTGGGGGGGGGGNGLPLALPFTHSEQFIHRYKPPTALVDQIFHISSNSIAKLKAKANKEANCSSISSFQALTALVWRAIVRAKGLEPNEMTACRVAANNRTRLNPPLSQAYFGNSVQPIITSIQASQLLGPSLGWVALLLHDSVANHTDKVVRSFITKWAQAPVVVCIGNVVESNSIKIGSSPRFDVYGNVFEGLGKPVAVRSGFGNRFDGKVNMHPGCNGEGSVDLEICLMPASMDALISDIEFINSLSF